MRRHCECGLTVAEWNSIGKSNIMTLGGKQYIKHIKQWPQRPGSQCKWQQSVDVISSICWQRDKRAIKTLGLIKNSMGHKNSILCIKPSEPNDQLTPVISPQGVSYYYHSMLKSSWEELYCLLVLFLIYFLIIQVIQNRYS